MGKNISKTHNQYPGRKGSPMPGTKGLTSKNDSISQDSIAAPSSSVLSAQSRGAISKSKTKKPLRRQQRLRKENGKARADAVFQQLGKKISRSKERESKVKNRRVTWDELNSSIKTDGKNPTLENKSKLRNEIQESTQEASSRDHDMKEDVDEKKGAA